MAIIGKRIIGKRKWKVVKVKPVGKARADLPAYIFIPSYMQDLLVRLTVALADRNMDCKFIWGKGKNKIKILIPCYHDAVIIAEQINKPVQ